MTPPPLKKQFSYYPNIGDGQGNGPGHPDGVRPIGVIQ